MTKKTGVLAPLLGTLLLWGCTAVKPVNMDWIPVDGGRSTGSLKLAVMWNPQHDRPNIDPWRAQAQAAEKCRAWGWQDAEQVGEMETMCTRKASGMFGFCIRKEAVLEFRCTNGAGGR